MPRWRRAACWRLCVARAMGRADAGRWATRSTTGTRRTPTHPRAAGGQQRHAHAAHQPQHHVSGPPAVVGDAPLRQRRPYRAGQVVAAGAHGHRHAAPLGPPQRGVGHERRERGGATQKAQQRVRQAKRPDAGRQRRPQVARAHRRRAHHQYRGNAVPVGQAAGEDAAQAQADHHQRVGQRGGAAPHAEFGLHRRQHHRHHVHAAVAQRHQAQRGQQPPGGGA